MSSSHGAALLSSAAAKRGAKGVSQPSSASVSADGCCTCPASTKGCKTRPPGAAGAVLIVT